MGLLIESNRKCLHFHDFLEQRISEWESLNEKVADPRDTINSAWSFFFSGATPKNEALHTLQSEMLKEDKINRGDIVPGVGSIQVKDCIPAL